jgi:DNA-3-methyladenine glycosylase
MKALDQDFYARPTVEAARALLGQRLCVRRPDGTLSGGRIVEVEAYLGPEDRASHAKLVRRGGRQVPTERSAIMFGPVGRAYVYLIYGMHNCLNVVAHRGGPQDVGAVLLRALEPDLELALPDGVNLRGPARLCAVLGVDRRHNGVDLTQSDAPIFVAPGPSVADDEVIAGPRIGVDYAGEDALLPYRLCVAGSRHLSRAVRAPERRSAKRR